MSCKNVATRSSRVFALLIFGANKFKSSTKNRCVMSCFQFPFFPNAHLFSLFKRNDIGFNDKINNRTDRLSHLNMPFRYFMVFDTYESFSSFMHTFVVHVFVSDSIALIIRLGIFARRKDSIIHECRTESNAF